MGDWVFVDTCIWSSYFRKTSSPERVAVEELIDSDRIALIGPIVGEVLQGFRRKDQADWAVSRLRAAHYSEVNWMDWRVAADLGRDLASGGNVLPLSDLALATVVKRLDASVYSTDPHFDLIPDLKRYWPPDSSDS